MKSTFLKQSCYSLLRLSLLLYLAVLIAHYLNSKNYNDYFSRTLIKVHAESKMGVNPDELANLIIHKDYDRLQGLLDRNYSIYALVITDCRTEDETCPGQKILFSTNPRLIWKKELTAAELGKYPYLLLRRPSSSVLELLNGHRKGEGRPGEIIGRVYSISMIPSFSEDYRLWLSAPFRNDELWRKYLMTFTGCLLGGFFVWLVMELFLKIRRMERRNAEHRENALIQDANRYIGQLEKNETRLKEQERRSHNQMEASITRIRELETKLQGVEEYRKVAENVIRELEEGKSLQSEALRSELEKTEKEKQSLREEIERYRKASGRDKKEASKSLENVMNPQFANEFEQSIFGRIALCPKGQRGEWRVVTNFDVGAGKGNSGFIDCIVISKDCIIVLEAKNYLGAVTAEGDVENSRWMCAGSGNRGAEISCAWGLNPYHQVREYTMSLLNLTKRGRWQVPVYGVIVFPEKSDISGLEGKIGRFYRVIRENQLVGQLEQIEAETRRENRFGKRPSPEQIEDLIRGRKVE